jgi:DNA-binding GntR family transcriptional regulator
VSEVYIGRDRTQPLPSGGLKNHPSLHERAYQLVRDAILEGAYQPGERLFESAIADALGVSRNPVREAIRRLQQEGLVEVRPRSGVFVASLSLDEARDLYNIRAALEGVAAKFAAERVTDDELERLREILEQMRPGNGASDQEIKQLVAEFHAQIRRAAHSPPLAALLAQVFVLVSRSSEVAFAVDPTSAFAEHSRLFDRLARREASEAENLMHEHVLDAYARLRRNQEISQQGVSRQASTRVRSNAR